jgi:hypothetical protein
MPRGLDQWNGGHLCHATAALRFCMLDFVSVLMVAYYSWSLNCTIGCSESCMICAVFSQPSTRLSHGTQSISGVLALINWHPAWLLWTPWQDLAHGSLTNLQVVQARPAWPKAFSRLVGELPAHAMQAVAAARQQPK